MSNTDDSIWQDFQTYDESGSYVCSDGRCDNLTSCGGNHTYSGHSEFVEEMLHVPLAVVDDAVSAKVPTRKTLNFEEDDDTKGVGGYPDGGVGQSVGGDPDGEADFSGDEVDFSRDEGIEVEFVESYESDHSRS